MATKIFINGREVTNPVARGLAAPFVALIAIGVIGLALLFLVPLLGLIVGAGLALAAAGSVAYLMARVRKARRAAAAGLQEAEVIRIEDGLHGDRRELGSRSGDPG